MGASGSETGSATATRRDGLRAVYEEHVDDVYRFVHRRCRDDELAEDITHDVFLAALRSINDPEDITIAWLLRVARNQLIDLVRRDDTLERKLRLVGSEDSVDHGPGAVERLRIERALGRLPATQRVALTLHYIDGITVASLADELGRSHKGAEALLTRARRSLRSELSDESEADDG